MNAPKALLLSLIATGAFAAACNRPLFDKGKPAVERTSPTIPPSRFKVLAAVAGGGGRTDLQISATVRQRLTDSGFTAVRRAGRWDNEADAVRSICAPGQIPAIDGVLFIWYNRLELRDCVTEGAAFEIGGEGASIGITAMTDRLVRWLRSDTAPPPNPSQ
jgi:hypothetical protein